MAGFDKRRGPKADVSKANQRAEQMESEIRAITDSRVQGSSSQALSINRIKGRRVSKNNGSYVGASIAGLNKIGWILEVWRAPSHFQRGIWHIAK